MPIILRFYTTLKFAGCQKGTCSLVFSNQEKKEVKLFLVAKQKHDLLLAFGGDEFFTYLAYLADIFEALNQLDKKLQGPETNIIVLSDAINAFVVRLNLWCNEQKIIILHHFTA